jgi:hypothetical protein
MNFCIFSPYNFQVSNEVINSSGEYSATITSGTSIKYMPLRYNLPNKFISLYQILDYAFRELFYNDTFDGILYTNIFYNIKDTDTLLSLVDLLNNNTYLYSDTKTQPFFMGMTKSMFETIGNPSFQDFNLIDNLVGYHNFKTIQIETEKFVRYG